MASLGNPAGKPYPAAMQDGKSQDGAAAARNRVLCIGGAVVDLTYVAERRLRPGTSNPATGSRAFGGVARNVAVNLARLGVAVALVSALGEDDSGRALAEDLVRIGVDTSGLRRCEGARTADYVALLEPDGSLAFGIADMAVLDRLEFGDVVRSISQGFAWIFADCNCSPALLAGLICHARAGGDRLAVDAVSTPKAERLPACLDGLDVLFLNLDEAATVLGRDSGSLDPRQAISGLRDRGVESVVLTLGADGLLLGTRKDAPLHIPAVPTRIVDVTGAGDALIAGTLAGLIRGAALPEAARLGTAAAALTLAQAGSTAPQLTLEDLLARLDQDARP